jgi:Fe-S oxidoreductase
LRAQNIGLKSRDLNKLTGAKVTLVQQCSGIDGMWGLRAENAAISVPMAEKLADLIRTANGDVVAGDCHLANTAVTEQTGERPVHPLQLIARAYGISEEVAPR